jgi:transposase
VRKIREILRYRFECKSSLNRIASALGVSKGSVYKMVEAFNRSGASWPLPEGFTDESLEEIIYKSERKTTEVGKEDLDFEYIFSELSRPHVTIELLWREYQESNPQGLSRATFFRKVKSSIVQKPDMKMMYKGGDLLFVDYSGDKPCYINSNTGEIIEAELFVACWGASSYTYAEVTATQGSRDFCNSHVNAFKFFGCVPKGLIPDNLKSGVTKADRYEPQLNTLYNKLAEHYETAVIPARVREPKDKAPVESAVGFVQRYILGRLRNTISYSLHELNAAIKELVVKLNDEPMQLYGGKTRRTRFDQIDKTNALALRTDHFGITDI